MTFCRLRGQPQPVCQSNELASMTKTVGLGRELGLPGVDRGSNICHSSHLGLKSANNLKTDE